MKRALFLLLLLLMVGCTTMSQTARQAVPFDQEWAVLPFVNNTETPYAAERAEAVTTALLYGRGVQRIASYQSERKDDEQMLPDRGMKRQHEALKWAKKKGLRYALVGTVTEWRYKVGLDGEPVAGVTLQLLDLKDDSILWSGSVGKSGWSRDAVSAVAQQMLEKLIDTIPAQEKASVP
ncbi:MAG: penicillin-binding protein activator LpoB [Geobacter sp.]|nr:penicillin-binding protein activator LpoB [Geobacter sp.]